MAALTTLKFEHSFMNTCMVQSFGPTAHLYVIIVIIKIVYTTKEIRAQYCFKISSHFPCTERCWKMEEEKVAGAMWNVTHAVTIFNELLIRLDI